MDQWHKLRKYPSYEITQQGDVRNSVTGTILKPQRTPQGYQHVTLCDDMGRHQRSIHSLVAEEFLDNPGNYSEVNHIDGDKTNNCVDNLEWCTRSGNMKHAYKNGLQKPIRDQIERSLSKAVNARKRPVRNIETGECYSSLTECAKKENLARSAVSFHVGGKARKQRFEYADEGGCYNGPTKS